MTNVPCTVGQSTLVLVTDMYSGFVMLETIDQRTEQHFAKAIISVFYEYGHPSCLTISQDNCEVIKTTIEESYDGKRTFFDKDVAINQNDLVQDIRTAFYEIVDASMRHWTDMVEEIQCMFNAKCDERHVLSSLIRFNGFELKPNIEET